MLPSCRAFASSVPETTLCLRRRSQVWCAGVPAVYTDPMAQREGDPPDDVTRISELAKTAVYLPEDRIRLLRERAGTRNSTMSALVRGAVDRFLEQRVLEQRETPHVELHQQRAAAVAILREDFSMVDDEITALLGP